MNKEVKNLRTYLMTGVSYMIPIVVIGGVLIALSIVVSISLFSILETVDLSIPTLSASPC